MNHLNPNRTSDPEALVQCPYDNTHMIRVLRWPRHIIKCRKNHPTEDLRTCPFNARHEVPAVELRHHIATCPDQVIIHQEILHERRKKGESDGTYVKGNTDVPPYDAHWSHPITSEDWDAEYRRHPVRVDPTCKTQAVTGLDRTGLTPSQRREHRKLLKQLDEKKKSGESVDEVLAAIRALASGGGNFAGIGQNARAPEEPKAAPRLPHGPPRVDTMRQMNGVRQEEVPSSSGPNNGRLAAKFNNLSGPGFGRGSRAHSQSSEASQVDKRYEILAKLAAGRGGPKPRTT